MKLKQVVSLFCTLLICVGLFGGIVLPVGAANPVYIINPAGTNGASGTLNGVSGTVYTSYAAFETAYTGTATADVYFAAGEYGAITVSKSVNLYGAKKGINPNVKGSDILQPWTLNPSRGSGETTVTGKFNIKTTGAGKNVLVDGFTVDKAGYFQVDCSTQNLTVTIQNIVVGKNSTRTADTDFFLNASPAVNVVPSAANYYMNFNLKNVHADGYKGGGHFIYFIAALNTTLDGIYYANNATRFLQTSAASRAGKDNFVMKNSFIYNVISTASINNSTTATIYHRFPSGNMSESVTYTDNVFYNAHHTTLGQSNSVSAHTIFCGEIKNKTQWYNFTGNTFVSEYGAKAPVRLVANGNSGGDGYDCSNMIFTGNRTVGYTNTTSNWDGSYGNQIKTYNGKLDLSNNFNYRISLNATADKVGDYSTVAKCRALTGMAPTGINQGVVAKTDGSHWKNWDMTTASAAGSVNVIDPNGADGSYASVNGVLGRVYTSYSAFESKFQGSRPDVHFAPGEYGAITVTKSVNLYGAKKGIDPNVKGSDILQPWTLNPSRGTNETVFTGKVEIKPTGKGNDVLVDGFTVDKAGQIWANASAQDLDITIRNIVVGKNGTCTDYAFWASPTLNSSNIPSAGNYYMTFNLKNIYADGYKGTGRFVRMLAGKKMVLDNIYYANSTTHFLETTAASYINDEYIMQNSFLYNNLASSSDFTIYHRFPSISKTQSVTYQNNVFYNAHRSTNGYANSDTIMCSEIKTLTHYITIKNNTFVTDYGARSPVRTATTSQSNGNGYDCSNIVFTENRVVGYYYTTINYDSKYGESGHITQYTGAVDLSDNFSALIATQNQTANKVNDYSTVVKCQTLTGVAPKSLDKGLTSKKDGPYYKNFDKTISTDMLRISGINLANASIEGTTIRGIFSGSYVPTLTWSNSNDIARTMTLKKGSETISAITESGTYTMTLGYEGQSKDYTLIIEKATDYTGDGYMYAPDATGTIVAKYWDGIAYTFTLGSNIFNNLEALFAKADADGVAVPKVLLPYGEISGDHTLKHSCQILGYKHGVNPIVRNPKPTEPDMLSSDRGTNETVFTGKWTADYVTNDMTFIFDGITLKGDGRFYDSTWYKTGETITYKNIICSAGMMSVAANCNVRFGNSANSEKKLTYQNIWADGLKELANAVEYQLFYLNGSDTVIDNLYMANGNLALCGNVFFQSAQNYTRGLSLTIQNSKFYNVVNNSAYSWFGTYYGDQSHACYRYADREYVKTVLKDNTFFNISKNSESNPAANAIIQMRYPYSCFSYELTGNTFVETREAYHFLTDTAKRHGTDVYSQFLHLCPANHSKVGPTVNVDLKNKIKVTGNRFIGRNTIINAELTYASTEPTMENNFYLGYEAVQKMTNINEIYTIKGEDPYVAINMEFGEVDNYYLDYNMTTTAAALNPAGNADVKGHTITLIQTGGTLTAADFATAGTSVKLYSDAACTSVVTSINVSALRKESYVYYMTVTKNGITETYTLVLHVATTVNTFANGILYDKAVANLSDGMAYYRRFGGALYSFVVGQTVFASMDDIVVHTQSSAPTVLLPAGNYTADELSVVESVNYLCESAVTYATPSVKKEKIKVLCVGDSITLGTGAGNRTLNAYPAVLQNLLGDDYEVINYGRGGSLGSDSSAYGYESTWNYSLSLKEAPDVVIMAFGANDSQNGYNKVPLDYFKEETLEMIRRYQALPSHPIVYMTTTTNIVNGWNQDWLTELRAIQHDTAETAGIGLIDGYNLSLTWGDPADIYSDNCHFNAAGYVKMANDYKSAVDWTEQGAHQPDTSKVKITFSTFACSHVEDVDNVIVDNKPTCGDDGKGHTLCTLCGEIVNNNVVLPATGKHVVGTLIVDTPPTATTDGIGHKNCTVCDKPVESNIVLPATGEAKIGNKTYATLEDALAAAKADEVILLNTNATVSGVVINAEVTVDLNGKTLTADYLVGFNTSALIDSVENGQAKIVINKENMLLDQNNPYLPVYDEEGGCYLLTRVKNNRNEIVPQTNGLPQYSTSPMFKDYVHSLMNTVERATNSGVEVIIRLSWKDADGQYKGMQDYIFYAEQLAAVVNSYENNGGSVNYGKQFFGIFTGSEIANGTAVTVSTVVRSAAGVEMKSTPVSLF